MVLKQLSFIPALYKIFDDLCRNAGPQGRAFFWGMGGCKIFVEGDGKRTRIDWDNLEHIMQAIAARDCGVERF